MSVNLKQKRLMSAFQAYIVCEIPARVKHNGMTDQIIPQRRQIFVRHENDEESIRDKIFNRDFKPIKMVGFENRPELNRIKSLILSKMEGCKMQATIDEQKAEIERLRSKKSSKRKPSKEESTSGEGQGKSSEHEADRDMGEQKS